MYLPSSVEPTVLKFSSAFSPRTAARMAVLMVGMILCRGRHTVSAALRAVGALAEGHFSTYHRVFSRASWSTWVAGRMLATLVLELPFLGDVILLAIDETTAEHKGPMVYGKGCHRDAVRSSHTHTSYKWGHKWVVLSVVVQFTWTKRPWALPILAVLYRPEKVDRAEARRHKTPAELARQLLAVMKHWFPAKSFVLLGDGGYATLNLAHFCARHSAPLVSRLRADAALYAAPAARKKAGRGRPRINGRKLASPGQAARQKNAAWKRATVGWYGGGTRRVRLLTGVGRWYNHGVAVALRWVYVQDLQGTHRDDCLFSTDVSVSPEQIVSRFTRRWSIEVTFEEVRAHLGFESTRQRTKKSVLRSAPCLLALYTVVSLAFHTHLRRRSVSPAAADWYDKHELTFSDAIATVRLDLWRVTIFGTTTFNTHIAKIARPVRTLMLDAITRAA
jgi:DDE superfamily endonuclease/Archaeal putative transposase ISC1217